MPDSGSAGRSPTAHLKLKLYEQACYIDEPTGETGGNLRHQ